MMTSWRITHVEETESTNLLARSGRPGDVFTADYQTAGRGRLDHRWLAERGQNLMMSAVIDVAGLAAEHAATLPLAVGLAVVEPLRFQVRPKISFETCISLAIDAPPSALLYSSQVRQQVRPKISLGRYVKFK